MSNRVVVISGNDPSRGRGGHSRYVRTLARAQLAAGYEPHIFCVSERSDLVKTDFGFIHRIASPFRPFRHLMVIGHAIPLAAGVEKFLKQTAGPHLIHSFSVWSYVGAKVARRLRLQGIDVVNVVTVFDLILHEGRAKLRGVTREHGFVKWVTQFIELLWIRLFAINPEKSGFHQARRIFVNYDSVRRLLASTYNINGNVEKLPCASETAFLESHQINDVAGMNGGVPAGEGPLIVCVSRHCSRKGVDVLLQALALLRQQQISFRACLVGSGPLLSAHRRLLTKLNLEDCVVITGFVPDSFVYLEHSDIFVLPSLEEGSGSMSLLEALQAGTAVVASGVDGIPEDVTHEINALLVRPGDSHELAAALRRLICDEPLRKKLRQRARDLFEERFLPERMTSGLGRAYGELGFSCAR